MTEDRARAARRRQRLVSRRERLLQDAEFRAYLNGLVGRFEKPDFIEQDPIGIPLGFDDPRDREVIGLYTAVMAWGRRETILSKLAELCERMDYRPYAFVRSFKDARDGPSLAGFGHRTFRPEDARALTRALSWLLRRHGSVENVFADGDASAAPDIGPAIEQFSRRVMAAPVDVPPRLRKHLARPSTGSACKRLAMYVRWMVRPGPVDLGAWRRLRPAQLVLPLDVHSGRQARALGLLLRPSDDWRAVAELSDACRRLAPDDPARYDFAFFGAGAAGLSLDPRWTIDPAS